MRLSVTDYAECAWATPDTVRLATLLKARGVDLVDCSTGGNVPARFNVFAGYQVPFSEMVRREAGGPSRRLCVRRSG